MSRWLCTGSDTESVHSQSQIAAHRVDDRVSKTGIGALPWSASRLSRSTRPSAPRQAKRRSLTPAKTP
ncbi:hypothetical protein DBR29_09035, partial [Pseudomonas sp. HMWF005]